MERAVPILPASDLTAAMHFYIRLGFHVTFQEVRDDDGKTGHRPATGALAVDLAQDGHRVGERADEQPDGQLAATVMQDRPHDARRELAHRQLHRDKRQ